MLKICRACGLSKDELEFYRTAGNYCKQCHRQRSLQYRKRPERRDKEREAKRAWLKRHPEVNRRNVAAYRARRKMASSSLVNPTDHALVQEAVERLGVTKQRVQQLIDRGKLAAVRRGGRWLIDRADLERMIEQRTMGSEALQKPSYDDE